MNDLEIFLANKFRKNFCLFTGSGTTAIYLILKALNLQHKKVLYPAITCMTPVNAAIYAGYEAIFCDVNLDNYTMDIDSLNQMIDIHEVGIIVPTHIYGHKCDMQSIVKIAHEKNIFVLEDSAQTIEFSNVDASIISFGHTKILECNEGGGAIFTNNENLYNKIKNQKRILPLKPYDSNKLFDEYREKYYSIMNGIKEEAEKWDAMLKLQIEYKKAFLYDAESNKEVIDKLQNKHFIKSERLKRCNLYEKYLDKRLINSPKIPYKSAIWRYSFLFNGNRDELLRKVRDQKIDISSWYTPLYNMYSKQDKKYFPNSELIKNEIVNLWVDPNYSEEKIKNDIEKINKIMKGM